VKNAILILFALTVLPMSLKAETIQIRAGSNYKDYSNEELRKRVWKLEQAVQKLQDQVFQLAMNNSNNNSNNGGSNFNGNQNANSTWACHMESFGKTFVSSGNTKASALAQVLKKCSDATNAVHCNENDVKCDNE
jgi:hypothetical protein